MKVLTKNHKYEVANILEGGQVLQFIHKAEEVNKETGESNFGTITDGTSNEEVLKVLIDRVKGLNHKMPCAENAIAIRCLEAALSALYLRTKDRVTRGVESSPKR